MDQNKNEPTPTPEAGSSSELRESVSVAEPTSSDGHGHGNGEPQGKYLFYLTLGALGVVYGDIGTSPLYAFRESFHAEYGLAVTPANVLGILSLILWSLIIVISIKYLAFVMRADNRGEGGILALTALVSPMRRPDWGSRRWLLIRLGLFGTALLYGDGMITPAISVLSAVEGLEVATPFFEPYIIPITIVILVGLFLVQSGGTEKIGKVFGPATFIWFTVLALLGIRWILHQPGVLAAANPLYGLNFFLTNGWTAFLVLGSVFLVVTGGEALYADMGHFGKKPIQLAWFIMVLPALLLNYFGQGALLLEHPEAVENPFYEMAPDWALYPVVFIATLATVIASQALITGAFSLTMQAVRLGYLPRVRIEHTSPEAIGQIYIPAVNWILMVSCVALVLAFRSSSNLAAAYGVAVTATMVVTTLLLTVVAYERWKWPLPATIAFLVFFLTIDLAFLGANLIKIPEGGWFPLVVGALVFIIMTTWKRGRYILRERLTESSVPFTDFVQQLPDSEIIHVHGTAVFMYSDPLGTPPALLHNLRHNKILHENVILLSVETEEVPHVPQTERVEVRALEDGFYQVVLHYGFREQPNVPRDLALTEAHGLKLDLEEISYFLGRERLLATERPGMAIWRENLFALMSRNARNATDYFCLPPDRVVELGSQIEL
ncbi:MAG: potassium uptake protein [Ardenticatenales bacterium]|nr:potassium uptake protein [Ardenticatenales bacterium]